MLYEIRCDRFMSQGKKRPPIHFNEGLNTILGGKAADNSIGKSTFMLIIDYAFGGDTYKDSDAAHHLGNHVIQFAFKFSDSMHYFSRDIVNSNEVKICDEKYNIIKTVRLDAFRNLLFKSYGLELPYISFRDVVGRYARIHGKGNVSSTRPLESFPGESAEKGIVALEKLFNVYWKIEQYREAYNKKVELQKFYRQGKKVEFLPFSTRTQKQFKSNEKEIEQLKEEINQLVGQTDQGLSQSDLVRADEASEIKGKLAALRRQRSRLKSQLEIVNVSINGGFTQTDTDLAELAEFFPGIDMNKLSEIEHFHGKLQNILSNELADESQRLGFLIESITEEIKVLEEQQRQLGIPTTVPKSFLDSYASLRRRIDDLTNQNSAYTESNDLVADVKIARQDLITAQEVELRNIEAAVNSQMVRYNDAVYHGTRKAPIINLVDGTKYEFVTPDDSGTGTSYKSLIVFDLSILKLTELPALIHDSLIFKNIADAPIAEIIKLYTDSQKQIFISFDKEEAYGEETSNLLNNTAVLHLSEGGNELFGYCWGKIDA